MDVATTTSDEPKGVGAAFEAWWERHGSWDELEDLADRILAHKVPPPPPPMPFIDNRSAALSQAMVRRARIVIDEPPVARPYRPGDLPEVLQTHVEDWADDQAAALAELLDELEQTGVFRSPRPPGFKLSGYDVS